MFEGFYGREEGLVKILRFNADMRTPMFYRTNDLLHAQRVRVLVQDMLPSILDVLGSSFDDEKALLIAEVHDDPELITGDVLLYSKERMTEEQLEEVKREEKSAISELASRWPKYVGRFDYSELLHHSSNKDCLEAQVVSWADKLDGYCESLHEVCAGNPRFLGPAESYVTRIAELLKKYPDLNVMVDKHTLFRLPQKINLRELVQPGKYHTEESVMTPTGLPHYDLWRELTIEYFGIENLVSLREPEILVCK